MAGHAWQVALAVVREHQRPAPHSGKQVGRLQVGPVQPLALRVRAGRRDGQLSMPAQEDGCVRQAARLRL